MAYVIAEPLDACPVDAIHPNNGKTLGVAAPQLYIQPDDCICCSACVPVCPVGAIYAEEDLPEKWKHYVQINRDWFAEVRWTQSKRGEARPSTARSLARLLPALSSWPAI